MLASRDATEIDDSHKLTGWFLDCILCQLKQCCRGSSNAVNFLFSLNFLVNCRLSFTFAVSRFLYMAWLSFTCTVRSASWPAFALHQHFSFRHTRCCCMWPTRLSMPQACFIAGKIYNIFGAFSCIVAQRLHCCGNARVYDVYFVSSRVGCFSCTVLMSSCVMDELSSSCR